MVHSKNDFFYGFLQELFSSGGIVYCYGNCTGTSGASATCFQ